MDIKPDESYKTFEDLKVRLDEIVEAVSDDDLPLDDALDLYEEAVSLGLRASDLLEEGIEARRAAEAESENAAAADSEGALGGAASAPSSNSTVSIPSAPAAAGSADPASAEDAGTSADGVAVASGDVPGN